MLLNRINKLQSKIRIFYYFVFMVMYTVSFCVPIQSVLAGADGRFFTFLGLFGLGLIAWDFFTRRNVFKIFYADIPVLFFVACLISAVVNRQYSFVSNIKGIMWMIIHIFVLATIDEDLSGAWLLKWFCRLADVFVAIWLVGILWSLGQYVFQISGTCDIILEGVIRRQRIGFTENRLFGVFMDPNYASVCSLVAIALTACNLKCADRPLVLRVYYIVSILLQLFYVVLSGSRTGLIAGVVTGTFCLAFLLTKRLAKRGLLLNVGMFLAVATMSVVVLCGCYRIMQTALSYVPGVVANGIAVLEREEILPTEHLEIQATAPSAEDENNLQETIDQVDFTRKDILETNDYSNNRLTIWRECLELVKVTPLLGATSRGYMELAKKLIPDSLLVSHGYSVHNGYLMLLVATGILGFGIMMVWCVLIVWKILDYLMRRWTSKDEYYWPVFTCAMALAVIAISAFPLQSIFFSNQIPDAMFWIILGFTLCFIRRSEPGNCQKRAVVFKVFDMLFSKLGSIMQMRRGV